MNEIVAKSEYAAWLAVMVEGPAAPVVEADYAGDPRPDLVPRPAYRALYLAAEESDWSK